jgi:hypothetical protein
VRAALLIPLALVACRGVKPRSVNAVSIIDVPASGGMAQFAVRRDGHSSGGHLSGDSPPMVYQEEKQLDSASMSALWTLVTPLADSLPAERPPVGKGYLEVQLDFGDGQSWVYAWPDRTPAPDSRVQAVTTWLLAHKIGGW